MSLSSESEQILENKVEEHESHSPTPTPSNPRGKTSARNKPQKRKREVPSRAYGIIFDMGDGVEYMVKNNTCSEKLDEWIIYRQYLELLESKFGIPVERLLYVCDPTTESRRPLLVFSTNADSPGIKVPSKKTQKLIREFLGTTESPKWYAINWPVTNSMLREILATRIEGYIEDSDAEDSS